MFFNVQFYEQMNKRIPTRTSKYNRKIRWDYVVLGGKYGFYYQKGYFMVLNAVKHDKNVQIRFKCYLVIEKNLIMIEVLKWKKMKKIMVK